MNCESVYSLRYQVYCHEANFLNPEDYSEGLEHDEFDPASELAQHHEISYVLVERRLSGLQYRRPYRCSETQTITRDRRSEEAIRKHLANACNQFPNLSMGLTQDCGTEENPGQTYCSISTICFMKHCR